MHVFNIYLISFIIQCDSESGMIWELLNRGFVLGKIPTNVTFALRVLMEKYRAGQKEPRCVFVEVDDRMLRQEV